MAQSAAVTDGKFSCVACGKRYAWKPQLAGKKAKCACGAALVVPVSSPTPAERPVPPPPPPAEDDLYDFAAAPVVEATRAAAPAASPQWSTEAPTGVGGDKVRGKAQPAKKATSARGSVPDASRDRSADIHDLRRDLFLPLGLIAAGFVGMLIWSFAAADVGAVGAVVISIAVGISTLVKTFVIILLALVGAPMFGISFGDLRTAIAKFAAVIIFTDMGLLWLDEIIESVAGAASGRSARRGYWIVTLLFATTVVSFLVRFLFDMDSEETGYVAVPLVIASLFIGWCLKLVVMGVVAGLMASAEDESDDAPDDALPGVVSPATPAPPSLPGAASDTAGGAVAPF